MARIAEEVLALLQGKPDPRLAALGTHWRGAQLAAGDEALLDTTRRPLPSRSMLLPALDGAGLSAIESNANHIA